MSIARVRYREANPFVQIDKRPLADSRLSWRARGILAYFLSKPDDWQIVIEHLIKQGTEGRDAVKTAFQELKECGYASLEVFRDKESGKVTGSTWTIHELAQDRQTEKPSTGNRIESPTALLENRQTGKPEDGKSATTNNDSTKKERTKKEPLLKSNAVAEIPKEINTAWFAIAWDGWLKYRKGIKKPLVVETQERQLAKLAKMGEQAAIKSIDQSITEGWTGLFEPKGNGKFKPNSAQSNGDASIEDNVSCRDIFRANVRSILDGNTEWEHHRKYFTKALEAAPSLGSLLSWLRKEGLSEAQIEELWK